VCLPLLISTQRAQVHDQGEHFMNNATQPASPIFPRPDIFRACVNTKPFLTTRLSGLSCLRPELVGARTHRIWKIHAEGHVGRHRTMLGLFIDQTLEPGSYDLVRNDRITAVYHRTPKQVAQVYHSRDFQRGSVTLLEFNPDTGRLRGTFEFAMSAIGFDVSGGEFDVVCPREEDGLASPR
jgi:hypothetical protein